MKMCVMFRYIWPVSSPTSDAMGMMSQADGKEAIESSSMGAAGFLECASYDEMS